MRMEPGNLPGDALHGADADARHHSDGSQNGECTEPVDDVVGHQHPLILVAHLELEGFPVVLEIHGIPHRVHLRSVLLILLLLLRSGTRARERVSLLIFTGILFKKCNYVHHKKHKEKDTQARIQLGSVRSLGLKRGTQITHTYCVNESDLL